ncbi:MAG: aldo/keto reductase [Betaproteobacteria bacterium]|nr:aldo/keto reductase [Betaproteobacteria bacterium]
MTGRYYATLNGDAVPMIGFGTSQLGDCAEIVAKALQIGYRHIDTAWKYGSEEGVGEGVKRSGIPRNRLFITTKVSHEYLRAGDFARSLEQSLSRLDTDYVDQLLVHWPSTEGIPLAETMGALAKAKREGKARDIGVANFNIALTRDAMRSCPEPLTTLQAEYHPYLEQTKVLAFCREAGLIFMTYCPLGRGRLFAEPVLADIARSRGKTIAQIALRWLVQQGDIVPIPRSANPAHMAESLQVFDFALSDEEMARIAALKRPDGRIADPIGRAPAWD